LKETTATSDPIDLWQRHRFPYMRASAVVPFNYLSLVGQRFSASQCGGRPTVKTTGDGVLAEFPRVVDAVRCAGEIQRAMIDRDLDLAEERRLRFRIGSISAT